MSGSCDGDAGDALSSFLWPGSDGKFSGGEETLVHEFS